MVQKIKDNKMWVTAILLAVAAISLIIYQVFFSSENQENKIEIVKQYSSFYTVNSCATRYLNYLMAEDSNSLMLLLSEEYKDKNNIKENNLFDYIEKIEKNSSFSSRKIYEEKISDNITKYYVKGELSVGDFLEFNSQDEIQTKNYYLIIYLDRENKLFSVEPYDGAIFVEGESL